MRISDWSSDVCSSDLHVCGTEISDEAMDGGIRFANTRQDATAHPSGNIDSSCRHAGQQGFEPVWKDGAKASNGSAPQQRQPILQILQRANQSCSRETYRPSLSRSVRHSLTLG